MRCPVCKRPVQRSDALFPFCSERCKLIDLGRWAAGEYRIPLPDEAPGEAQDEREPPRERGKREKETG